MSEHDQDRWKFRILHIITYMERLERITTGKHKEDLLNDETLQLAVIRCFEVIGKAAYKIPDDIRAAYPTIDWQRMADLRHRLIHDYEIIDLDVLWNILCFSLPETKKEIEKIPVKKEDLE